MAVSAMRSGGLTAMGKHTFLGSSTSWDQIPQPVSLTYGENLLRPEAPDAEAEKAAAGSSKNRRGRKAED